jgi:leucyl aminopeptidase
LACLLGGEYAFGQGVQKPGDVQIAMPAPGKPGKTIEIINTDAEGRLVLADGMHLCEVAGMLRI